MKMKTVSKLFTMKKNLMFWAVLMTGLLAGTVLNSCKKDDPVVDNSDQVDDKTGEAYKWGTDGGVTSCDHLLFNGVIGNGDQEFVFTGKQTIAKGTYTLKGWVYVADGAELTIEPGTVIKGHKLTKSALIVEPGGKLYAQGTSSEPIVFTSGEDKGSRKPGDWGGLIVCGKARNNQGTIQIEGGPRTKHGGNDDSDNSGVISYVRVEFAGYPFESDKEINAVTFGSVGSGTQVDHVQVSYTNDDSYEWFGGAVNCKYLIAYKGWDDEFDTDNGFSGKVQFGLSVRDPRVADKSMSNGFESDNCADGASVDPYTSCTFSNMTFIGPKAVASDFSNSVDYITGGSVYPNNGSGLGLFQAAMQIRRGSRLNCFNSIATGYPIGIIIDGEKGDTPASAQNGLLAVQNVWMSNMDCLGSDKNKLFSDVYYNWQTGAEESGKQSNSRTWFLAQSGNQYTESADSWQLADAAGVGAAFMPQAGSPLLSAASFSDSRLAAGFDRVSYIGAFAAGDSWLDGWTEFDPQNADY